MAVLPKNLTEDINERQLGFVCQFAQRLQHESCPGAAKRWPLLDHTLYRLRDAAPGERLAIIPLDDALYQGFHELTNRIPLTEVLEQSLERLDQDSFTTPDTANLVALPLRLLQMWMM